MGEEKMDKEGKVFFEKQKDCLAQFENLRI